MHDLIAMNETRVPTEGEPAEEVLVESAIFNSTVQVPSNQTNEVSTDIREALQDLPELQENMANIGQDYDENMEAGVPGVRNARHLPKEVNENAEEGDLHQADENVRSTVISNPEAQDDRASMPVKNNTCDLATCLDQNDALLSNNSDADIAPSLDLSERRLFGVNSLTDEVRKLRNQRNKLLSRANLKRKRKRKKSSHQHNDQQKNKTTQTRQSMSSHPAGPSNSLTNSLRQHFASPLQFPSVQKMILGKLNRPQPSASNQHLTRIKPTPSQLKIGGESANPSASDLFFKHHSSGGAFLDHQQQNSEALNQWLQSETMPLHTNQNVAKQHHQMGWTGGKMIPIEIIGLDPAVTKSILNSNSQMGASGSEAQADMSQLYPASNLGAPGYAGDSPTINSDLSTELALKDLQATRGSQSSNQALVAPTERPSASSILHIHHFHTQAKPSDLSQQQQQQQSSASNIADELHHQQEYGMATNTVAPTLLKEPPTDAMQTQHMQAIKEQAVSGQPQQVYVNDKGELVYLTSGSNGDPTSQDNRITAQTMSDIQDMSGEQHTAGSHGIKHQVSSVEAQIRDSQYSPAMGEQAASSIIQQQLQQRQHMQQFIGRDPANASDNRGGRYEAQSTQAQKQRVFLTTNGQMISVITPNESQQQGDDDKLLMVAYKPQHLQNFRNITTDDSMMGVRNTPYNEGQESQSSLISASGQHLVLKNPSLLIKNTRYQQPDGTLADSIAQQLASLRLKSDQNGGLVTVKNSKLPVGAQISASERASPMRGLQQSTFANQLADENNILSRKPTPTEKGNSAAAAAAELTSTSGFSTWFQKNHSDEKAQQQSNGYGGNVFSPTETFKNNTMSLPNSLLYKQQQPRQHLAAESNKQLQQFPLIAALTQTGKASPSPNGTNGASLMSNDLFAGLLKELKLKNSGKSNGNNYTSGGQHLTRTNTTSDFDQINVSNSASQWNNLMPNYVENLMVRNSSNQARKILSPYDNLDKTGVSSQQRQRLNNLLEADPITHENNGLREAQVKQHHRQHQSIGLAPEELDFGDATNGLSNLALAFIFVVSLLTLTIIAASMIYRHRRRSIGRCVDLPSKTRLNLKQKTKRFVFNNFKSKNQEVASIKSINLNITDGNQNNNLSNNNNSPKSNDGSNGRNGDSAMISGNTMTKSNRSDRISINQTFGMAPMSTFAGTPSSQLTDESDIKTIKTRLQKPSYLKSLISAPECPVKLANSKKQQLAGHKGKSNQSDAPCYLDAANINHKSSQMKPLETTRSPNGNQNSSFNNKTMSCDLHKQNYNFAFAKVAPSEISFSDRISMDSRMHSDRMSTIHSIDDATDSKSNIMSTCEAHGPFKKVSNISCRATKLGNLMGPQQAGTSSGYDLKRNRNDPLQMDRL